jgi:Chromo (CHRromatin Organisation MOdifier) domain
MLDTFRLRIGEETVRVSSDRVTPAPRRETTRTILDPLGDRPPDQSLARFPVPPVETTAQGPNEDNPPSSRQAAGGLASALPSVSAEAPQARTSRAERRVRFTLPDTSPGTQSPSSGENQEYVVDRIVDAFEDQEDGTYIYRVSWMGYTSEEDTWEPERNLPHHFIRRYWKSQRTTPAARAI